MRIRTIKPEFFTHEELADLELASKLPVRLAFIGLWCAADREGRFKWKPRSLGVQILPFDDIDFLAILDLLVLSGFVAKYQVDDNEYGFIPSFANHQVINNREQESHLPPFCATSTRLSRVTHAASGEGKERKGKEGKETSAAVELPFDSVEFRAAWESWVQHRNEKKKPLTASSVKQQFAEMKIMGEARSIAMIRHSIKNGWQGLFENRDSAVVPIRKPLTSDQFSI